MSIDNVSDLGDRRFAKALEEASRVERFILVRLSLPETLDVETVTAQAAELFGTSGPNTPTWMEMTAEQVYPGDVVPGLEEDTRTDEEVLAEADEERRALGWYVPPRHPSTGFVCTGPGCTVCTHHTPGTEG